jgi:V/A-type H+/Na+-transporting ATPase subunit D
MTATDQAPTRAAVLALSEERVLVGEAYDFLDEKRLLLAAELLRQLEVYARLGTRLEALAHAAGRQLAAAVGHHGLEGLSVYPAAALAGSHIGVTQRNFMGVTLVETSLATASAEPAARRAAANPSPEAEQCRSAFSELLQQSAVLAGVSGNLYRLQAEYRLTDRRARALENVIIPEIEQALRVMGTHLEELDFEDAVRVRLQVRSGHTGAGQRVSHGRNIPQGG